MPHARRRLRQRVVASLAAGAVAALGGALPASADSTAPPTSTVSGHVSDPTGAPVDGAAVLVRCSHPLGSFPATSAPDGSWSTAVPRGAQCFAVASKLSADLLQAYSGSAPGPRYFTVDAAVTGIDFQLPQGGAVTGTVTVPPGQSTAGMTVGTGEPGVTAPVGADGTFRADGMRVGSWSASLKLPPDSDLYAEPSSSGYTVTAGATTTGVDFVTHVGATVSGVVTHSDGSPATSVHVYVSQPATAGRPDKTTTTDATGHYALRGLRPGTYVVVFSTSHDPVSPGAVPSSEGTPIELTDGTAVTVNQVLVPRSSVSLVQVHASSSDGPALVQVTLVDALPAFAGRGAAGVTDGAGNLDVWVQPGTTRVGFAQASGDTPYVPQFWTRSGTTTRVASAAPLALAGGSTAQVTAHLSTGARITGFVMTSDGAPAPGRLVTAADGPNGPAKRTATTAADGSYTIRGLLPGRYRVAVANGSSTPIDVYYGTGIRPTSANVTVRGRSTTSGIDITVGTHFADVQPSAPFAPDIAWLAATDIVPGEPRLDGALIFDPAGSVRRDAMAAYLYRAAGSPDFTAPAVPACSNIAPGSAFSTEIDWLASAGISTGTTVRTCQKAFDPTLPVRRDAVAAFLHRASEIMTAG
jgi:hypothetical protein